MTTCPTEETLAAFIDGRFDRTARGRVVEHLAECGECRDVASVAREFDIQQEVPVREIVRSRFPWKPASIAALSAAAATLFVLFLGPIRNSVSEHGTGIRALARVSGELEFRTVEPRIDDTFPYKHPQKVFRSANPANVPDDQWKLFAVAGEIRDAADEHPSPENLHAFGIALILTRDFDKAITTLQRAHDATPSDPRVLNDLAAAYIARGATTSRPTDYAAALELLQRPEMLSIRMPSVLFNRALVTELLLDRDTAIAAWRAYLAVDSTSEWANEARKEHLEKLEERPMTDWDPQEQRNANLDAGTLRGFVAARPRDARKRLEDVMLPEWAASVTDRSNGTSLLKQVVLIGRAIAMRTGAREIDTAVDRFVRNPTDLAMGGIRAFGRGREAAKAGDLSRASKELSDAYARLAHAGSPFAVPAGMSAGLNQYYLGDYKASDKILTAAEATAKVTGVSGPWLAELFWVRGMVLLSTGRPHESLQSYLNALHIFEKSNETESVGAIHGMIAENYEMLGETALAWSHRLNALSCVARNDDRFRLQIVLNEAAEAALNEGQFHLALTFQESVTRLAQADGDSTLVAYALLWRSLIHFRLGDLHAASDDIKAARGCMGRITHGAPREKTEADIDIVAGMQHEKDDPALAVQLLSHCLEYNERRGNHVRKAQLLLSKGSALERLNDIPAALANYKEGIAELEQESDNLTDDQLRSAFFAKTDDLIDRAIGAALAVGNVDEAFNLVERARIHMLRKVTPHSYGSGGIVQNSAIQDRVPSGVLIIEYAVLKESLVAWTVRRGSLGVTRLPVDTAVLERDVESLRARPGEFDLAAASSLYDALIRPFAQDELRGRVVFVPDKFLHSVPFAALYDRERRRFLIEDTFVVVAPSSAVYLEISGRPKREDGDLLAIGTSRERSTPGGVLPALTNVPEELHAVCAATDRCRLLLDDDAVLDQFRQQVGLARIIHIAGHTIANDWTPSLTALAFTPDLPRNDGLLYARDIAAMRINADVVVLSACSTAELRGRGTHAIQSLAWAFLAAGGSSVVGTLWPIEDGAARELFVRFQRELRAGATPAAALRNTQLAMLHGGRETDSSWASLELIGSDI
jgi:CHAT domain-containing protein